MSKIDFSLLVKRVTEDIKKNPEKRDEYLRILMKHGLLKQIPVISMKRVSMKLLDELDAAGTKVKIV